MNNKYVSHFNLKPGDEIIVPKSSLDIIQHHALYIGFDESGTHWIIHNNVGVGVSLVTVNEFFRLCSRITRINRYAGSNTGRRRLVQRALQTIGKPYDLIDYNCEHFTTEMKTGKINSKQVENALLGAILLLFMRVVFSD